MAWHFGEILALNGSDLANEFFEISNIAERRRATEHRAVIKIQRTWKRHIHRRWIRELQKRAVILQSAYKGHVSRNEAATYLCWRAKEDRIHHYNKMATDIQRIWRGYLSRKLELDYYKRKNYIAEIKTRGDELRIRLNHHMKEQIMQNEREKIKLVRQYNEKLAGNLHHLLSTKSIPGVLSTRATTDSHPHNNDCQGFGYTKSEQAGTGERQPILTHAVKDSFLPMSIDYVHTHVANDQPSSTTKTYHMCELVPAKRRELLNLNETLNRKVGSDEIIAQKRNVGSKITADSTARLAMGRLNERQLKNNNQLKSFIRESLKRTSYQPTSIARHKFMADFDSSNE